jgi:hypothetical protein
MPLESNRYKFCTELVNLTQNVTFESKKSGNNPVLFTLRREAAIRCDFSLSGFQVEFDEIAGFRLGFAAPHPHAHAADHESPNEGDPNQHNH